MTDHRRPLLLVAATAFIFPACINIHAEPAPITPPEVAARITAEGAARATEPVRAKSEFAMYPSRPGEVIPIKPAPKETTVKKLSGPEVGPPTPKEPEKVILPTSGDPGAFPLGSIRSSAVPEPPLLAAVRAFIEGKQERAIEHVMALGKPNQDLVLALVPVLVRGASTDLATNPVAVAVLVDQLRAAAAQLEPQAALQIESVRFCEYVWAFGRYTPWPKNKSYRPTDVAQLYFELRNLLNEPADGPRGEKYQTHARAAMVVRDANNRVVQQRNPGDGRSVPMLRFETHRFSHSPIQDFHMLYAFPVPNAPGVYSVTLEAWDAAGRRTAHSAPVEFTVAGP